MFTGIIETLGIVKAIHKDQDNLRFEIQSDISNQLKPDQSVSHNGICLTITKVLNDMHYVTAVRESIERSNIRLWSTGTHLNLERSLIFGGRLDGHFVQGHVDTVMKLIQITDLNGSTELTLYVDEKDENFIVEKGSICLNGISLTISGIETNKLKVVIIPYTYENTNIRYLEAGALLNVEFDILGKYLQRIIQNKKGF
jgi:riboflavin synthase